MLFYAVKNSKKETVKKTYFFCAAGYTYTNIQYNKFSSVGIINYFPQFSCKFSVFFCHFTVLNHISKINVNCKKKSSED